MINTTRYIDKDNSFLFSYPGFRFFPTGCGRIRLFIDHFPAYVFSAVVF